jgi:sugar/nucleoside kinase (ribokinase family)
VAAKNRTTALVVGTVTLDFERRDDRLDEGPGGVVHHAGLTLLRLGAAVRVVTRVHPDHVGLLDPLRAEGAEVLALKSRSTTTYRNDYTGPVDQHELLAQSDTIAAEDLPADWRHADVVHLGPLHPADLEPEVVECVQGLIGLDLQGLLRRPGAGQVRLRSNPNLGRYLTNVQVVHANQSEIEVARGGDSLEAFAARHEIPEMLVTEGEQGALLLTDDRCVAVSANPRHGPYRVGSGDAFLSTYLLLRARGHAPLEAASGAADLCELRIDRGEVPKGFQPRIRPR